MRKNSEMFKSGANKDGSLNKNQCYNNREFETKDTIKLQKTRNRKNKKIVLYYWDS